MSERDFCRSLAVLVEVTRGPLVESRHLGAVAVVDSAGRLLYDS